MGLVKLFYLPLLVVSPHAFDDEYCICKMNSSTHNLLISHVAPRVFNCPAFGYS